MKIMHSLYSACAGMLLLVGLTACNGSDDAPASRLTAVRAASVSPSAANNAPTADLHGDINWSNLTRTGSGVVVSELQMAQTSNNRVYVDNFSAPIRGYIVNAQQASADVIDAARSYLSSGKPVVLDSDGTVDGMQKVADVSMALTGAFGAPYPAVLLYTQPGNDAFSVTPIDKDIGQGALDVMTPHTANQALLDVVTPSLQTE